MSKNRTLLRDPTGLLPEANFTDISLTYPKKIFSSAFPDHSNSLTFQFSLTCRNLGLGLMVKLVSDTVKKCI